MEEIVRDCLFTCRNREDFHGRQTSRSDYMKSQNFFWIAAFGALLLCVLLAGCNYRASNPWDYHEAKTKGIIVKLTTHDGQTEATGDWDWRSYREGRQYSDQPVFILFETYDASRSRRRAYAASFGDLIWVRSAEKKVGKDDAPIQFALTRPAGRWNFGGKNRFGGAKGTVVFQPNTSFIDELSANNGRRPTISEIVQFSFSGLSIESLRNDRASGMPLNTEDVLKLQNYGITSEYAASMRSALGSLSVSELVECHNYGLAPDFVLGYSQAGYTFRPPDLIKLKTYGVNPEFAAELKRGGMNLSTDQLVQLHNNGVPPAFALRIKQLGFGNSMDDIIAMRNSGLQEDYVSNLAEAGYRLSKNDLIQLNNYGVPADYVKSVRRMGYSFSIDQIVKLRSYGVSEAYLQEILLPGRKPLPADLIVDLHSRGVPAQTVRAIRAE
jgi:hypothetical protein